MKVRMARAVISIEGSREEIELFERALRPEMESSPQARSRARLERCDGSLRIIIEAPDTTSLRAAVNSFTRLVKVVRDMLEIG